MTLCGSRLWHQNSNLKDSVWVARSLLAPSLTFSRLTCFCSHRRRGLGPYLDCAIGTGPAVNVVSTSTISQPSDSLITLTSNDLEYLPFLVSMPVQTVFEYFVGCWKRSNSARSALLKKASFSYRCRGISL
jgi:hypothetical protein